MSNYMNKAVATSTIIEVVGQTVEIHMGKDYNFSLEQMDLFLVDTNHLYPVDKKVGKEIIYKASSYSVCLTSVRFRW